MGQPNNNSTIAQQAPACFGSPSCYAGDSNICRACVASDTCGDEVINTLQRIKQVVNIEDLLHRHRQTIAKERSRRVAQAPKSTQKPTRPMPQSVDRKTKVEKITYEIDEVTQQLIGTLPVKAQPFAVTLCKSGLIDRIKKDMINKINPLEKTGPKFLALALRLLLEGGFTKADLRGVYTEKLSWTENTAASHVSLVVRLLTMFEIATEVDGQFVANPTLMTDNSV